MKEWTFNETTDAGILHNYTTIQHDDGRLTCNCPGFGQKKTLSGRSSCRHTRRVEMSGEVVAHLNQPNSDHARLPFDLSKNDVVTGLVQDLMPQLLQPIDEADVQKYIDDICFGAQEKMDGKRILLDCRGPDWPIAINKKGKVCDIPDDIKAMAQVKLHGCVVDGELIDGKLYLYDILWNSGTDVRDEPYGDRYFKLRAKPLLPSPGMETKDDLIRVCPLALDRDQKRALFAKLKAEKREGIVFKRLASKYRASRNFDQLKFKFVQSVSCYVIAHNAKSSIRIGLVPNSSSMSSKDYIEVGNCTIPTGMELPPVGSTVEIRYLYANQGGSLYQPVFLGIRDDTDVDTMGQLKYKHDFHGTAQIEGQEDIPKEEPKPVGTIIKRKIQWK